MSYRTRNPWRSPLLRASLRIISCLLSCHPLVLGMSAPFAAAPARPYTRRLLLVGCVLLSLLWLLSSSPSSRRRTAAPIERAIPGTTYTFSTYLEFHFPLHATQELHDTSVESTHARSSPQIVLTIADSQWLDTATAALQLSLATINRQREARPQRPVQLVVLTLDDGALQKCRERGMYCYGGYRGMVPVKGTPRDWYKAAGELDREWEKRADS